MHRLPLRPRFARPFLLAVALLTALPLFAADTARRGAKETALDRYVAAPDATFAWKKLGETREDAATTYALELISQTWLTAAEVSPAEWRHPLTIIKPDQLRHSTALLMIGGGSIQPGAPPRRPSRDLIDIAQATGSVVVELRLIPNQKLTFRADGVAREEDDIIGYSWNQFLRTGDERWPARLPMTKAVVRAMDAVTAFLATPEGGAAKVDTFVVAGLSKRGWTVWTAAAVDRRVIAICPMVIDVLNVDVSINHHYRAYGFYAPSVGDYVRHHIVDWTGTPEAKALYAIEDPFSYRDRLTIPKLMLNAVGDQFFLPDSSQFYFAELPGTKYLRYAPNTDHGLRNAGHMQTLRAWHHAILNQTPLPEFTWKRAADGTLTVSTKAKPTEVLFWQATNPAARDFRLEKIGPAWKSSPVEAKGSDYTAAAPAPAQGWTASFMELTFDLGAGVPLKLTTDVQVLPNTLPFSAPKHEAPKGFLSGGKPKS